jgi:hypothetical protein
MDAANELEESTDDVGTADDSASVDNTPEDAESVEASIDAQVEGQPKPGTEKPAAQEALTPDKILEELGKLPANQPLNPELIKYINGLGALHNGLPIEIKDDVQLKELIQQGHDYRFKTMQHAEQVRAFEKKMQEQEAAFSAREKEFSGTQQEYTQIKTQQQLLGALFQEIARQDPALFEDINSRFMQIEASYKAQMPLVQAQEERYGKLEQKLDQILNSGKDKELQEIRSSWKSGWDEFQTKFAPQMARMGIAVDQNKIQQQWASDATGKMTVMQAVQALYGDQLMKAYESHKKMLQTKTKTMGKKLHRTGANTQSQGAPTGDFGVGNYSAILKAAAAEM